MGPIIDRRLKAPPVFGRTEQSVTNQSFGTAFSAVTGASITLPVSGTYRVYYHLRSRLTFDNRFLVGRLFNQTDNAVVPDTEVMTVFLNSGIAINEFQGSGSMETVLAVTSSTIIRLEAKGNSATGCNSVTDSNGRTLIGFNQL